MTAAAVEFKSVGPNPVILYDAPSLKGAKRFIAPRGMPVEVVLSYGAWSKVRDAAGDLSWVESKDLVARRMLVVRSAQAQLLSAPSEDASVLMSASQHVLLELVEAPQNGWAKVRHRDGALGFVRVNQVWGL